MREERERDASKEEWKANSIGFRAPSVRKVGRSEGVGGRRKGIEKKKMEGIVVERRASEKEVGLVGGETKKKRREITEVLYVFLPWGGSVSTGFLSWYIRRVAFPRR